MDIQASFRLYAGPCAAFTGHKALRCATGDVSAVGVGVMGQAGTHRFLFNLPLEGGLMG